MLDYFGDVHSLMGGNKAHAGDRKAMLFPRGVFLAAGV